jgi:hypothetical protein
MKKVMLIALLFVFAVAGYSQDRKMTEIKASDLPKGVTTWVNSNLPGGKITRAGKIEEKGTISYAAVVEAKGSKHSYIFDKDGKFVGKGDNVSAAPKPASTGTTGPKTAPPAQKGAPATTTKTSGTNAATEEAAPKK